MPKKTDLERISCINREAWYQKVIKKIRVEELHPISYHGRSGGRQCHSGPLMHLQDGVLGESVVSASSKIPGDDVGIGHAPTIPVTFIIFIVKEIPVCFKVLVLIWQDAS